MDSILRVFFQPKCFYDHPTIPKGFCSWNPWPVQESPVALIHIAVVVVEINPSSSVLYILIPHTGGQEEEGIHSFHFFPPTLHVLLLIPKESVLRMGEKRFEGLWYMWLLALVQDWYGLTHHLLFLNFPKRTPGTTDGRGTRSLESSPSSATPLQSGHEPVHSLPFEVCCKSWSSQLKGSSKPLRQAWKR